MRVLLTLSFLGGAYAGFQRQTNAVTVQGLVEDALRKLTGARCVLHAAGRTDAGVHAVALPAHFDTASALPPERYARALNDLLPPAISVTGSRAVPDTFHARFDAVSRSYLYKLWQQEGKNALVSATHWQVPALDLPVMRAAAAPLLGAHDFAAFSSAGSNPGKTTVRNVSKLEIAQAAQEITLTVTADGFLYNMVRVLTAQLVLAAVRRISPEEVLARLQTKTRAAAREVAPPQGLYFLGADY
jgi:tRNA pseudouridine38-40 synthase